MEASRDELKNEYTILQSQYEGFDTRALQIKALNRYVCNLAPMPGVFPDYPAPVIATPVANPK